MSVPNHSNVPRRLFDTGLYNLRTEDGQGAFTDAVVSTLNGLDPNWGHLIKKPGQTDVHHHGEDSALYKSPIPGQSCAVDFIGGAGGPNPQPGWMVDEPRYSERDWLDPTEHRQEQAPSSAPRIPSYGELGDDAFFRAMIGVPLQADMLQAGQPLNDGSAVWFSRLTYRLMAALIASNGQPVDASGIVRLVRNEWRAILGQPPV